PAVPARPSPLPATPLSSTKPERGERLVAIPGEGGESRAVGRFISLRASNGPVARAGAPLHHICGSLGVLSAGQRRPGDSGSQECPRPCSGGQVGWRGHGTGRAAPL